MEHHSNIVPGISSGNAMARDQMGDVDDEGNFLIEEFEKLLTRAPRSSRSRICRMHSAPWCRSEGHQDRPCRGIPVLSNGAQSAVHLPIRLQDLDCDFYAFTGHKVYGPTGIGALYAKHGIWGDAAVQTAAAR